MSYTFNLPDLGEGLPDAEIHEWHVQVGDFVKTDQLLVSMETAKAVVEVPSPTTGVITKLYGNVGDIIDTGSPLVEYVEEKATSEPAPAASKNAAATVAGALEVTDRVIVEPAAGITPTATTANIKALPAVRMLAKQLNVDIANVTATGPNGQITAEDIKNAAQMTSSPAAPSKTKAELSPNQEALRGVRRAMAISMAQAHAEVVGVTLVDDADIHAWPKDTDITVRVLRAIAVACKAEPALNALYDGKNMARELKTDVNIGMAMDSGDGLFVPVIKNADQQTFPALRQQINTYKEQVKARTIPPADLQGATISLSNFGVFAGRYANPVVVPPCVAIIGTGKIRDEVVAAEGNPAIHRILPLSLTFDHRAATGGEASRFLGALIQDLQQKE